MKAKYIRISSAEQNTARQEINSNQFEKVYIDKISGAIKMEDRPEGKKLIKDIEAGKIKELHVVSICRLGRDLLDILTMVDFFNKHQVNMYVENIGMFSLINRKPNSTFSLIVSVLANVSALERSTLLERQRIGIELAKQRGSYKGRLYGTRMNDDELLEKYKKVVKELKNGESLRRAAAIGDCSLGTAQRVQRAYLKLQIPEISGIKVKVSSHVHS